MPMCFCGDALFPLWCDVLQDGEIMERGGHAELLQRGGMYAHMWTQQQHSLKPRNEGQSREEVEESNV